MPTRLFFKFNFIVGLLLILASPVYAGNVEDVIQKGEECKQWMDSGQLQMGDVHRCVVACKRYGTAVKTHPSMLNDAGIQNCYKNYATAKAKLKDASAAPKPPVAQKVPMSTEAVLSDLEATAQYWASQISGHDANSDSFRRIQHCQETCDQGIRQIKARGTLSNKYLRRYWNNCTQCVATDASGNELKPNL